MVIQNCLDLLNEISDIEERILKVKNLMEKQNVEVESEEKILKYLTKCG